MLDFRRIQTPLHHGDVLIEPPPRILAEWAKTAGRALNENTTRLLDVTLGEARRSMRDRITGEGGRPVIVTGHQPDFIHPGVWAKQIVAARLARAVGGRAINLVVDNDAPKETALRVPVVAGDGVRVAAVPYAGIPAGWTFEQIPAPPPGRLDGFEHQVRTAMAERFRSSLMPDFLRALRQAGGAADWVEAMVRARRSVESPLGVDPLDVRVSCLPTSVLFADWMLNAPKLVACYNEALARYRRHHRVRSPYRPIPDLLAVDGRWELPLWVTRPSGPRERCFVEPAGDRIRIWAGAHAVGDASGASLTRASTAEAALQALAGWRLRPRALALTAWTRLFLADVFIHGIGGAKYDRITDGFIRCYYGIEPPPYACVSATWLMDLPRNADNGLRIRDLRHAWRDLRYNPQRRLRPGPDLDGPIRRRGEAVSWAARLAAVSRRDRAGRRAAFETIRRANAEMLGLRPEEVNEAQAALADAQRDAHSFEAAAGREYFFGLHDRSSLEKLLAALPGEAAFAI